MAKSAKDYAKEQLGSLDLSYLDKERDVANSIYNTSKSSLETNFNNLLDQINSNRADTRKNFNTGRATVAENAFTQNKQNEADLASRGVGSGGLKTLGEVGNRMETGRQYSNLANEFYNTMSELDTTETQGRSQYDIDSQNLKNTLNQTLASIDARQNEAENAYNMALGQLAEQIQGRWDSNANAQAALKQQQDAAQQAHQDALNAAKQSYIAENNKALNAIVNSGASDDSKISQLMNVFGIDSAFAKNLLIQMGAIRVPKIQDSNGNLIPYSQGYNPNENYLDSLRGSW